VHFHGHYCIGFTDGIWQGYLHFRLLLGKEWELAVTGVSWRCNLASEVWYSQRIGASGS
jgi:hypothetical protein